MPHISIAEAFATAAHHAINQRRKYTYEPYINHPAEVAHLVSMVTEDPEIIAAAWLHDVVEDTGVTSKVILHMFGARVTHLVKALTDVADDSISPRAARAAVNLAHLAKACPDAQTIKLADIISNSRSLVELNPDFARVWIPEAVAKLEVLPLGDANLRGTATTLVRLAGNRLAEIAFCKASRRLKNGGR
jgi:(p)ppGpp synthase/HD superfamily hydrolase